MIEANLSRWFYLQGQRWPGRFKRRDGEFHHRCAQHAAVVTTSAEATAYTENDPATVIDSGATVADVDNPHLVGATVTITNNLASPSTLLRTCFATLRLGSGHALRSYSGQALRSYSGQAWREIIRFAVAGGVIVLICRDLSPLCCPPFVAHSNSQENLACFQKFNIDSVDTCIHFY